MTPAARIEDRLMAFPPFLRGHGFAVSPDRTAGFLEAVRLLGPRGLEDIRKAAIALFAVGPDQRPAFDALFETHFLGRVLAPPSGPVDDDDDLQLAEDRPGDPPDIDGEREAGGEATVAERLGQRTLRPDAERRALTRLLPTRRSRRTKAALRGMPDLRRAAREALRRDGDLMRLPTKSRRDTARRILLLVDVSGSMSDQTASSMRFAHRLIRAGRDVECFTLGTRLTRVTRALRLASEDRALAEAGAVVADWDGGTRLGDAMTAYLSVPRFAGHARGALVLVISDGLERGDPGVMISAVARLSRLAWRLIWLTPLATGASWQPATEALQGAAPHIDHFGRAGATATLTEEFRRLAGDGVYPAAPQRPASDRQEGTLT